MTKRDKQQEFLSEAILNQRAWIESCEKNGRSYADGERGIRIREADEAHLRDLESQYRDTQGR